MATLHVRNVPDKLYEALRARAEQEGRSIGGQTVALLEQALGATDREERVGAVRRRFRVPRRTLQPGERLGPGARRVLAAAQQEARGLHHRFLGTEHLLLGLLHETEGTAARVLRDSKLELEPVRERVAELTGEGEEAGEGPAPFTPRTKDVLELALREALSGGEDFVEPEHLLVALAREGEGVAAQILREHGADAAKLRGMTTYVSTHFPQAPYLGAPPTPMEYCAIALEGDAEEWTQLLNELAGDGWRLETLTGDRAVFSRPAEG